MKSFVFCLLVLAVMVAGVMMLRNRRRDEEVSYRKSLMQGVDVEELKSRAAGDAEAKTDLALAYMNGAGVEKDVTRGIELLREAADSGSARAQLHLGLCYDSGEGVKKDANLAQTWIKRAADQGYKEAKLAFDILNGMTV